MKMMVASGMKHVTYAESTFAFNIIARFKKTLNLKTFTNWAQSLHGMQQKRLIQYSQYLNVATMRLLTEADYRRQEDEQFRLISAIRGLGEEYIDQLVPDCVKILVNECNTLGETLLRHTMHRLGTGDGKGGHLISMNNLVEVIKLFHYNCTHIDKTELRFWVFNNDLVVENLEHHRDD